MLQNYGKQQIKNIPFLLWKCLHVERRELEREGGGKDITMCLQTPTTRRGEKVKEEEGGCNNDSVWI